MDVIWNLTKACPWDCAICCVSGFHICDTTKHIVQAAQKEKEEELTMAEKIGVLEILANRGFEVDFSGGDPLYYDEDFKVVEQATRWMPARKIGVSATGSRITDTKIDLLKKVGVAEFTLDNLPEMENPFRPRGYNLASMVAMKKCVAAGIKTRAVTVLYSATISEENLENVYHWLCENSISEWELLRLYPVGRAAKLMDIIPSDQDYLKTMKFLRGLHCFTKIFFQHSLRILEGNVKCPAVSDSIGILPDGQVTACAWAIDDNCRPLKRFRLGKLPEDDLDEIIDKARKTLEYSKKTKFCRTIACIERDI
ncbi:MAG: radical SAM protein [Patescibacteria group bacterium]